MDPVFNPHLTPAPTLIASIPGSFSFPGCLMGLLLLELHFQRKLRTFCLGNWSRMSGFLDPRGFSGVLGWLVPTQDS